MDLTAANALALELATEAETLHERLRAAPDAETASHAADALVANTARRDELRRSVISGRLTTLEQIHASLARLRALTTVDELLQHAPEELARCCDFDRTAVSRVRGSVWRAVALWLHPGHDPCLAADLEAFLTEAWRPLDSGVLETEVVRRRTAALVTDTTGHTEGGLMAVSLSTSYVAAPIQATGRVVGFLQADCFTSGRELTTLDRDNISSFADAFGLVFERTALLERLGTQRARIHEAFDAAEHQLSGLGDDSETMLIRRDREAVAIVRTASGLRKAAVSPVDQLLTAREREVVELMVTGARNSQIADELVIAEETVKSHVRAISRKLRASSRADAVARYLRMTMRARG